MISVKKVPKVSKVPKVPIEIPPAPFRIEIPPAPFRKGGDRGGDRVGDFGASPREFTNAETAYGAGGIEGGDLDPDQNRKFTYPLSKRGLGDLKSAY